MGITRRQLLGSGAAAGLLAGMGVPCRTRAQASPGKVLEVFLQGGFSPWNSFWYDPTFAARDTPADWSKAIGPHRPAPTTEDVPWMQGNKLGANAQSLYGTWLLDHCRVVVMKHDLEPHEAAVPYAITGSRLGRPTFASLGAAVNGLDSESDQPFRAVVLDGGAPSAARYAAATNVVFGREQVPLSLRMGDADLEAALLRTDHARSDAIKDLLRRRYARGLVAANPEIGVARSNGYEAYDTALTQLTTQHLAVRDLLAGTSFGSTPAEPDWTENRTRVALRTAVELLESPSDDVRYVCVIDAGALPRLDYDTHDRDGAILPVEVQAGNQFNVFDELAELSERLEALGALVAVTTEFGRMYENDDHSGTEHWPHGYVNLLMGGTIPSSGKRGLMDAAYHGIEGGLQLAPYNPTDIRVVLAEHLGVASEDLVSLRELSNVLKLEPAERDALSEADLITKRDSIIIGLVE